jgi:hypothetical protein
MTLVSNESRSLCRSRSPNFPRARADAVGEGGDRLIVGDVDDLGGDVGAAVGPDKFGRVPPRHDDPRALRLREQGDGARDATAASDHQDRLVP